MSANRRVPTAEHVDFRPSMDEYSFRGLTAFASSEEIHKFMVTARTAYLSPAFEMTPMPRLLLVMLLFFSSPLPVFINMRNRFKRSTTTEDNIITQSMLLSH